MPRIIPRAEWGARYEGGDADAPLPAREVWLHHSATTALPVTATLEQDMRAVRQLEEIGESRFRAGISYTFAVAPSGRIFEGHGIRRRGTHTGGRNSTSRAIVLIGNYETARPSAQQLDAVAWLLAHGANPLIGWWPLPRLAGGHRDAPGASTACPGSHAHAAIPAINGLASRTRPTAPDITRDEVDMASIEELRALVTDIVRREVAAAVTDIARREVAAAVWSAPIPDYYQPANEQGVHPSIPAFAVLGHGTAHAAHCRDAAMDAAEGVDKLLERPASAGPDPSTRYRLVPEA